MPDNRLQSRILNLCEAQTWERSLSCAVHLKQRHFRWVSVEPVLVLEHSSIKYLLIVPGLQVPLLSFIARTLCSPDNPTQHTSSPSDSPYLFLPLHFSISLSVSARVVKATGSQQKRITGVCVAVFRTWPLVLQC